MAVDLSTNSYPHNVTDTTIGTSYEDVTVPENAQFVYVRPVTNAGSYSHESGTPTSDIPLTADTMQLVWVRPLQGSQSDYVFQIKAASASTTVHFLVF